MSHIPPKKMPKCFSWSKDGLLFWPGETCNLELTACSGAHLLLHWALQGRPWGCWAGPAEWQRAVLTPYCPLQAVQRWGGPVIETYPQRHPPTQSARVQAPRHCPAHEEPSLEFCPLILYLCAKGNGLGRSLTLWSVEVKKLPLERLLWHQGCPRALGVEAKPSTGEGHLV